RPAGRGGAAGRMAAMPRTTPHPSVSASAPVSVSAPPSPASSVPAGPTVGFDLDMTLIDSRPGIRACYLALAERTGTYIDADLAVTRLGPPLAEELVNWFPAEIGRAACRERGGAPADGARRH